MDKYQTNPEYRKGYNAAALCEPYDEGQTPDWREGWKAYQEAIDATETGKYI